MAHAFHRDDATYAVISGSDLPREVLTGARTYYVRTDGLDSNTGLVNSAGGAFLTINAAIAAACALDRSSFEVTITVTGPSFPATFTTAVTLLPLGPGTGAVTIQGDTTTPSNIVISCTNVAGAIFGNNFGFGWQIGGFKLTTATAGDGIQILGIGNLIVSGKMEYGTVVGSHISSFRGAAFTNNADSLISGGASVHWFATTGSELVDAGHTITLTGTPAFGYFALADTGAVLTANANTFSGGATGQRFQIDRAAGILDLGGLIYFPGNVAGVVNAPGWHV